MDSTEYAVNYLNAITTAAMHCVGDRRSTNSTDNKTLHGSSGVKNRKMRCSHQSTGRLGKHWTHQSTAPFQI